MYTSFVSAGIIGNKEAQPVQEVSSRQFGSAGSEVENKVKSGGGLFGIPIANGNDYPKTPGPPLSDAGRPPTTDTSMIQVPRAIESQLTIDNLQFMPEYSVKTSPEFMELADIVERELKAVLFPKGDMAHDVANVEIKVMDFQ